MLHEISLAPFTTPPLSLNGRLHHMAEHKLKKRLRELVGWRATEVPRGGHRLHIVLHYEPRNAGRRDEDNLVPTLKPCTDELVRLGVIPDDTPEHVEWDISIDPPNRRQGRLWLEVEVFDRNGEPL